MEWVETTAGSVTEAKDLALDKLGVHDSDAVFEILEEPKKGFLGRTKGVARVRARIAPKAPPPKNDRNRRRNKSGGKDRTKSRNSGSGGQRNKKTSGAQGSAQGAGKSGESKNRNRNQNRSNQEKKQDAGSGAQGSAAQGQGRSNKSRNDKPRAEKPKTEDIPVDQVIERVEDFLGGLVGAFGLEGGVSTNLDGDDLTAKVAVTDGVLIGPKGRTLDAIQELTRVSAQRLGPTSARIKVDVGGYREARKVALVKFAAQAAEKARSENVEVVLEPMSSADRKVLHDALGELEGVGSRSAGNEPRRRVVVVPEAPAGDEEE
jgi:spoIIIJ-associated protein